MCDSHEKHLKDLAAPFSWDVRPLGVANVGALMALQAGAPAGAVAWSISDFISAFACPWLERVGYLCLGLYASAQLISTSHNPSGCAQHKRSVLNLFGADCPVTDTGMLNFSLVSNSRRHSNLVADDVRSQSGDMLSGFIILHVVDDEAEIQHLAVDSRLNGRGGGTALLYEALSRLACGEVKSAFLEVRVSHGRALRLYQRVGFEKVGIRRGYYADTGEGAIIMKCVL